MTMLWRATQSIPVISKLLSRNCDMITDHNHQSLRQSPAACINPSVLYYELHYVADELVRFRPAASCSISLNMTKTNKLLSLSLHVVQTPSADRCSATIQRLYYDDRTDSLWHLNDWQSPKFEFWMIWRRYGFTIYNCHQFTSHSNSWLNANWRHSVNFEQGSAMFTNLVRLRSFRCLRLKPKQFVTMRGFQPKTAVDLMRKTYR